MALNLVDPVSVQFREIEKYIVHKDKFPQPNPNKKYCSSEGSKVLSSQLWRRNGIRTQVGAQLNELQWQQDQ